MNMTGYINTTDLENKNICLCIPEKYNYTQIFELLKKLLGDDCKILARPSTDISGKINWYFDGKLEPGVKIKKFNELNTYERDNALLELLEKKKRIEEKVSEKKTEPLNIVELLFITPNGTDNYYAIDNGLDHDLLLVITQWAIKLINTDYQPELLTVPWKIDIPKFIHVLINAKYNNGDIAGNKVFYFDFELKTKENETPHSVSNGSSKTDKNGVKDFKMVRPGSTLKIYDIISGEKKYIHDFIIDEGTMYNVIFPLFADAIVKVINQKNIPVSNFSVIIELEGIQWNNKTDNTGNFKLTNLEVGKKVKLTDSNQEVSQEYAVEKENNIYILRIIQLLYQDVTITILDQFDRVVKNKDLIIESDKKNNSRGLYEYKSDEFGIIHLKDILEDSDLIVKEKNKVSNIQTYKCSPENKDFIFRIEVPVPRVIKIKVIDDDEKPLVNREVTIIHKNNKFNVKSDENGYVQIESIDIKDGDNLKILIKTDKKEKFVKLKVLKG
jgi:hypothetical protein